MVASGGRPKFTFIQKSDIVAWAIANAKTNDASRELKTALETEAEAPDSFMAKALKARLLQLKDEGVERIVVPDGDGDKSRERGKSSKKGKPAPAVEESRPESGGKEELSKRKNKIREKNGKSDIKPIASMCISSDFLGDEPLDGPNAYYVLKGFDSPSLLAAMIDEFDVPVNGIANIIGSPSEKTDTNTEHEETKDSLKSSEFPFVEAIKGRIRRSPENSTWRNIAWLEINGESAVDYKEVFDIISAEIYRTLAIRNAFDRFYENDTQINVPLQKRGDIKYYESIYHTIGFDNNLELVLSIVAETVARQSSESGVASQDQIHIMDAYLESRLQNLAIPASSEFGIENPNFHQYHPFLSYASSKVVLHGDKLGQLESKMKTDLTNADISPVGMLTDLREHYSKNVYIRAVSAMSEDEKVASVTRSQLVYRIQMAKHLGISFRHVDRALLQFEFETLVQTDLDEYCWTERFDSVALLQTLQRTRGSRTRYSYYPLKNCLLLAIDDRESEVTTGMVKTRVGFGLFHDLFVKQQTGLLGGEVKLDDPSFIPDATSIVSEDFPDASQVISTEPKFAAETEQMDPSTNPETTSELVYATSDTIIHFADNYSVFGAEDGSKIEKIICESTFMEKEQSFKFSWNDNVITFGATRKSICLSSNDETTIFASIDEKSQKLSLQVSTSDGLFVEVSPTKSVTQTRFKTHETLSSIIEPSGAERHPWIRKTLQDGTTIVHKDGKIRAISADGSSHTYSKEDSTWTTTSQLGVITRSTQSGEIIPDLSSSSVRVAKDYQNDAMVIAREDLVNVTVKGTTHDDAGSTRFSSVEAEHSDSTVMKTQSGRTVVVHPSFAKLVMSSNGPNVIFQNRIVVEQAESGFLIALVCRVSLLI